MKRKMPLLARAVVYLLAFLVAPVLVAFVGMRAAEPARYEAPSNAAMVHAAKRRSAIATLPKARARERVRLRSPSQGPGVRGLRCEKSQIR
jgi:hypothetical protein